MSPDAGSFVSVPGALSLGLVLGMLPPVAALDAAPGKAGKGRKAGKAGRSEPPPSLGIDASIIDRNVKPATTSSATPAAVGSARPRSGRPPRCSRGFAEMAERNQTTLRELLERTMDAPGAGRSGSR